MAIVSPIKKSIRSPVRRPITGYAQGGGGGPVYPLDDVGGAAPAFAYSTNKLSASYSGFAIRVVRPSDSATLDVGFVGAELDTASLDAFLGSTAGQVDIWYDQEVGAYHATQTTAANRAVIEPSSIPGGPIEIGGHRAIIFGPTAYMDIPAGVSLSRQACHAWQVMELQAGQLAPIELGSGSNRASMYVASGGSGTYININPGVGSSSFRVQNARACIIEGGLGVGAGRNSIADQTTTSAGTTALAMTGGRIGGMSFAGGYDGDSYCSVAIGYGRYFNSTERGNMTAALESLTGAHMSASNRVWFVGDSIAAASVASSSPYQYGYTRMAVRQFTKPAHCYTLAGGGNQLVNMIAVYNNAGGLGPAIRAYSDNRAVHVSAGTNDFNVAFRTSAQIYADLQAYCALIRADGAKVIVSTVLPASGYDPAREAERLAYNANVRANWASFADGLCDFAADATMGAPGAQLNAALYTDGLHPSRLGHSYLAPIAAAAINALI